MFDAANRPHIPTLFARWFAHDVVTLPYTATKKARTVLAATPGEPRRLFLLTINRN
jgi:hypothetical protein